jgi:lipopolysaccharide transport system ATP-binding protein
MVALRLENLGKAYKTYATRWHRLAEMVSLSRFQGHDKRWVLRNVDLSVQAGEALGVIGMNGAGKSTLLKLVTGTSVPTEGSVVVNGRVSAILELGLGFHQEFSGRQNILIAGMLLGMTASEIAIATPDVVKFAELGDYIEQPVRTYSSGMQVRLAFSVATALRPDILIVDEALSVGDVYFQHKSFRRIREFHQAGTTVLFVSHDPSAVKMLCDRAVLLDGGRVVKDGAPDAVLDYYNAIIAARENAAGIRQESVGQGRTLTRSGSGEARIERIDMTDANDRSAKLFGSGEPATILVLFRATRSIPQVVVGLLIRDRLGLEVFGTNTFHHGKVISVAQGVSYVAEFRLRLHLGPGSYSITAALTSAETHLEQNYDWVDSFAVFEVINRTGTGFIGTAFLPTDVNVCSASDLERIP